MPWIKPSVADESLIMLPLVLSNKATLLAIEEDGPVMALSAGYVKKTFFVPAVSVIATRVPSEFDRIVVRARVGPVVEYVPMPTSHAEASTMV
jgi:hypothetical protein